MIRKDIVRMYREIHSWVGIVCGLFLFIAFYAGAISMFEIPLQRWTSAPIENLHTTPLRKTQELIDKVSADHPKAARNFNIVLSTGPEQPSRMQWARHEVANDDHSPVTNYYADLTASGELVVKEDVPSPVAQLIDDLHQQVGILIDHERAMLLTGVVSLLYTIALVSGLIVLLPNLAKELFALRLGKKVKRMWLDVHNLLGIFSLPFHLVMALTALVFAWHDFFYSSQKISIYSGFEATNSGPPTAKPPSPHTPYYPVDLLIKKLNTQAPEFTPEILNYRRGPTLAEGHMLLVAGTNLKHHANRPRHGVVSLNPFTGDIMATDYMPGRQQPLQSVVSSFFALHFGNFGGNLTRWLYFILGLGGALLFYTGNLLWIEVRRKRSRSKNLEQTRSSRILGSLSVGVSLGCIAAISLAIACAKLIPTWLMTLPGNYVLLYYSVFLGAIGWSFYQGPARACVHLLYASALCTLCIPLASVVSYFTSMGWNHGDGSTWVDGVALMACLCMLYAAKKTAHRISNGSTSSIWSDAT